MIQTIQQLLDSDVSGYQIQKHSGVADSIIANLRTGKRKLENLRMNNALKLYALATSEKESHKVRKRLEQIINDNTAYQISQATNLNLSTLQKYSNGTYNIDNMTILYAEKILSNFKKRLEFN